MKKWLSILLCVLLVVCMIPVAAFAGDEDTDEQQTTEGDTQQSDETAVAVDITDAEVTVTLPYEETPFTGSEIKPDAVITVAVGESTLTAETDYTCEVTYSGNTNAGTATVTATVKGTGSEEAGYYGEASGSATFEITPIDANYIGVNVPNQTKGGEFSDETVTWGSVTLVNGTDYDVECDNSKLGTASATFTFKGNYSGSITIDYDVVSTSIANDGGIYFTDGTSYTFTGSAITPDIYVEIGTDILTAGTDYTVEYSNNVNAGTATVTVHGAGVYSGALTHDFTIKAASISDCTVTFDPDAYTATGSAITPTYTITLGDYELTDDDYTVSYANNTAIGDATATFTGKGNFSGTRTEKFSIVYEAVTDLTITLETTEFEYDGTAKEPAVEVKDGDTVLTAGTDYTVAYEDNISAGTGKVIVTGMGKYGGTETLEFTINGKDNVVSTAYTIYTKYLTSSSFNLHASAIGDQTDFTYTSSDEGIVKVSTEGDVSVVGTGKATITVSTVGTTEYNQAQKVVTVNVKPLKPATVTLTSPSKKTVKVTWSKVEGATKYQVRYGRQGTYYIRNCTHIDSEYTKTYTNLTNRTSGRTYYIKVRSVKVMDDGTTVYGNYTDVQHIKSK